MDATRPASKSRAVLAAALGNTLEWFDLIIYALFAASIGRAFFPAADPAVSLLIALGTFGVAFFMRPLGGIVLGSYADRRGRKSALVLTTTLMMIGTGLIAVLPPYAYIGIFAPLLVILARLIQGFSAGGEFGAATTFLAEQAPDRKTFYTSWQFASQGAAMALGSIFGLALPLMMTAQELDSWGWRIPFLVGLVIGPVSFYIRTRVGETPAFMAATPETNPLARAITTQKSGMAIAIGMIVLATVSIYMFLYMPAYAASHLGLRAADGAAAALTASMAMFVIGPITGYVADRVGRIRLAFVSAAGMIVLPIPLYAWLIAHSSPEALLAVQAILGCVISVYLGVLPALLSDLHPVRTRTTAMSLSYNLTVMLFGGFAPFIIAWLITVTGWRAAPSYYISATAVAAVTALAFARRKNLH